MLGLRCLIRHMQLSLDPIRCQIQTSLHFLKLLLILIAVRCHSWVYVIFAVSRSAVMTFVFPCTIRQTHPTKQARHRPRHSY